MLVRFPRSRSTSGRRAARGTLAGSSTSATQAREAAASARRRCSCGCASSPRGFCPARKASPAASTSSAWQTVTSTCASAPVEGYCRACIKYAERSVSSMLSALVARLSSPNRLSTVLAPCGRCKGVALETAQTLLQTARRHWSRLQLLRQPIVRSLATRLELCRFPRGVHGTFVQGQPTLVHVRDHQTRLVSSGVHPGLRRHPPSPEGASPGPAAVSQPLRQLLQRRPMQARSV